MDRHQQFVGMYDLRETLGKGHFSVVKLAEHVISKQKVAIKVIEKAKLNALELEHLHHEVRVMKMLRHPNVVRLYQVFDTTARLYLILELGSGGDLYDHISKNGRLTEQVARDYFWQIVSAVKYCHKHRVVHRDLKPENVVFCHAPDGSQSIKVTDFGLSNNFSPGEMMKTMCGSLCYSAPEVLLQEPYDGPAADIWSLGVILFMMVAGRLPFKEHDDSTTLFKILDVKYDVPVDVTAECKELIGRLLVRAPEQRISLEGIEQHPWMQDQSRTVKFVLEPAEADERGVLKGDDHQAILRKMHQAGIEPADVETALASNAYDHVTSTYFLLAEQHRQVRERVRSASSDDYDTERDRDGSTSPRRSPVFHRHTTIHGPPSRSPSSAASPARRLSVQGAIQIPAVLSTGKHTGSLRRTSATEVDSLAGISPSKSPTGMAAARISLSQSFPAPSWSQRGAFSPTGGPLSPSEVFKEQMQRANSVPEEGEQDDADSLCSSTDSVDERSLAVRPLSTEENSRFCVIS